jgi:hypothetical protein
MASSFTFVGRPSMSPQRKRRSTFSTSGAQECPSPRMRKRTSGQLRRMRWGTRQSTRAVAGDLESRIGLQRIDVIAILMACRDQQWVATVGDVARDAIRVPEPAPALAQDDQAIIRGEAAGVLLNCERLARDR